MFSVKMNFHSRFTNSRDMEKRKFKTDMTGKWRFFHLILKNLTILVLFISIKSLKQQHIW